MGPNKWIILWFKSFENTVEPKNRSEKKLEFFLTIILGLIPHTDYKFSIEQQHLSISGLLWCCCWWCSLLWQTMRPPSSTPMRKTIAPVTTILSSSTRAITRYKSIRQISNLMIVLVIEDFSSFYLMVLLDVYTY